MRGDLFYFLEYIFLLLVFIFIIGIILYILKSIGLMRMADKLGIKDSWFAWLPIGDLYILGQVAGNEIEMFDYKIEKLGEVLAISAIITGMISSIPLLGIVGLILYLILFYSVVYKVFRIFKEESAISYLILSIVFGPLFSIFIFSLSKHEPEVLDGSY